jgi:transcription initiation factor TFIID subunit 9B
VLQDASQYAHHASKSEISLDDIRLAIQSKVNYSFTQPPPREVPLFSKTDPDYPQSSYS